MITRFHSAGIYVKDQDAALDFYVNKLGWEKLIDQHVGESMRFLTVAPSGASTQLSLMQSDERQESLMTLIADDVQATYDELTAKGVTFNMPVETMPWGAKGTELEDPDGILFRHRRPVASPSQTGPGMGSREPILFVRRPDHGTGEPRVPLIQR